MDLQNELNNNWCNNMDTAPRDPIKTGEKTVRTKEGSKVIDIMSPVTIWVTDGEIVTKSYWVGDRWNMFTKDNNPIAWQPYLIPEYKG